MNEMEEMKIAIAEIKKDIGFLKEDSSENRRDTKEILKQINESLPAMRNDINLANKGNVENKIEIGKMDVRVVKLETEQIKRKTVSSLIVWVIGILGAGNILSILAYLFKLLTNT